jgi:outer membrane murein-binding lipoprotein Lpp
VLPNSRRRNVRKKLIIFAVVIASLVFVGGIGYGIYWKIAYEQLSATIEAANGSILQGKLSTVTAELERVREELTESQQSVGRLEEIDRRRNAGLERIERSLDTTGTAIRNALSGNARAEAALRGIQELSYILEAESGGGSK